MKKSKGFTLMEMVMVLVVIGLLVSIAVPKMAAQMKEAQIITTKKNLEALRAGLDIHLSCYNRYPASLATLTNIALCDPVILKSVPSEGVFGKNTEAGVDPCDGDGLGGWTFNGSYGDVAPNISGVDMYGIKYCEY